MNLPLPSLKRFLRSGPERYSFPSPSPKASDRPFSRQTEYFSIRGPRVRSSCFFFFPFCVVSGTSNIPPPPPLPRIRLCTTILFSFSILYRRCSLPFPSQNSLSLPTKTRDILFSPPRFCVSLAHGPATALTFFPPLTMMDAGSLLRRSFAQNPFLPPRNGGRFS